MSQTLYALSSLSAPTQNASAACTAVLDPATQTGVHHDADGIPVGPARMADGTGTGTGYPKADHDSD